MIKIFIEFLVFLWKSFYFAIPGGVADAVPVVFSKVNFLNYPVDFGKKWRGKPIFGSHKTFRGFFFGILATIAVVYLQRFIYVKSAYFRSIAYIDYTQYNMLLFGFLIGFGILFGDLVKSFIKRRLGKKPGESWFPWDQLDCVIGVLIILSPYYFPPWQFIVFLFIVEPIATISLNHFVYYIGIKKTKW